MALASTAKGESGVVCCDAAQTMAEHDNSISFGMPALRVACKRRQDLITNHHPAPRTWPGPIWSPCWNVLLLVYVCGSTHCLTISYLEPDHDEKRRAHVHGLGSHVARGGNPVVRVSEEETRRQRGMQNKRYREPASIQAFWQC